MKAYVVKYAVSKGIFATNEAEPAKFDGFISVGKVLYGPGDWAPDWESAVELAQEKVDAKIRSAEAKLAKLRGLEFKRAHPYERLRI